MVSPVAKKATKRLMRWHSAGVMRLARSFKSVAKSTSSTVHVFLMAALYISKNTGYFIGRSVRLKPGSRIMKPLLILLAGLAALRVFQGARDLLGRCRGRGGGRGSGRG